MSSFRDRSILLISPSTKTVNSFVADMYLALNKENKMKYSAILSSGKHLVSAIGLERTLKLNELSNLNYVPEALAGVFSIIYIMLFRPRIVHIQHEYRWLNFSLSLFFIILASKTSNSKVIVTMHSVIYESIDSKNKTLKNVRTINPFRLVKIYYVRFLNRFIVRFSDALIVHSTHDQRRLQRINKSQRKIFEFPTLPGPSDMNLRIACLSKKDASDICVVIPGYIEQRKGQDIAIRVVDKLSELDLTAHLHIVGSIQSRDGELFLGMLREMIDERDSRVSIDCRFLMYEELTKYISSADVVILPYRLGKSEDTIQSNASGIFSLAAACGKLIVASKIPYFEKMFSADLHSLLFDEDNPMEAAQIIKWALSSDKIFSSLKKNIFSIYKHQLSIEQITKKHSEIYSEILY